MDVDKGDLKNKMNALEASLIIAGVLMIMFFVVVPGLLNQRCSLSGNDPVYVPSGAVGQVVGPMLALTCRQSIIIVSENISRQISWIWLSMPILAGVAIIIGLVVQGKGG